MTLQTTNFTGHLLVAMPTLTDPFFVKSVIYICAHSSDGAMGIMVNRPTDMTYAALFEKINLRLPNEKIASTPVLLGGPVQPDRGFILHPYQVLDAGENQTSNDDWDSSIHINKQTTLTTSKDILTAVASNQGPQKMLLSLGYAGWTPGQLEEEMAHNAWLSIAPSSTHALHTILFDTPFDAQLEASLALLGVRYSMLSDVAGHA